MLKHFFNSALIAIALLTVVACQSKNPDIAKSQIEVAELGPAISLDDHLELVSSRPSRALTKFFHDTIWTVDYNGKLFSSNDSGYSWSVAVLPDDGEINFLQFSRDAERGIVVTNEGTLMRTEDAGTTWTASNLAKLIGSDIDQVRGSKFYEFSFDEDLTNGSWVGFCQIYRTEDGGQSWARHAGNLQDTDKDLRCASRVAEDTATGMLLADVDVGGRILTSGSYLFRSDDRGETWTELCSLDEVGMFLKSVQSCYSMEGLPELWRDLVDDSGIGDMQSLTEFADKIDQKLVVEGHLPIPDNVLERLIYVGMTHDEASDRIWYDDDDRLAYTDDAGESWHVVANAMPGVEYLDFSAGIDRAFAIYPYQHVVISRDIGKTWQTLIPDLKRVRDFVIMPQHNRLIVAVDEELSVVEIDTLKWRDLSGVAGKHYVLENVDEIVWSFTGSGGIYRSPDAGETWSQLPVNLEQEYFSIDHAVCQANACSLVGSREDTAIARISVDPFLFELSEANEFVSNLEDAYAVDTLIDDDLKRGWLATSDGRLFGSEDGGRTWDKLAKLGAEISDIDRSPGGSYIIVRGEDERYLYSNDGNEFQLRRAPIGGDGYISSVCWLTDSLVLMNATVDNDDGDEKFLASVDGGATWGETSWFTYKDECLMPGGFAMLHQGIAKLK